MPSSFDENEDSDSVFIDMKMDEFGEEEMQPPKRRKTRKKGPTTSDNTLGKRKKTSKWWAHFSVDEEDTGYASCKYCQHRIGCSTKNGTTPLANHINRCKKYPPNLDKKKKLIDFETKTLVNEDGTTEIEDDWKMVGSFLPFLSVFYDSTLRLSGSNYVTCNSYAHEIYGTRLMISNNMSDDDEGVKKMAAQMMSKHKLSYVDWIVRDSYDETRANLLCLKIKMILQSLFDSYASSMPQSKTNYMTSSTSSTFSTFTQSGGKVDLQQLMASKYQRDMGCSLINANKNWLRTSRSPLIIEESLLALEKLEEGMKDLTLEQPDIIIDETNNSLDDF
ncbi:hypothetical protein V6N12_062427 [Hibiscus sabdariffa]|uniref:BED-type domain-containing protein n=1 Tax=Hibiscus sabdariffa TaxID=183260 RepID=A0ABR2F8V2_9ROSI